MPRRAPRACAQPGCAATVTSGGSYCSKHKKPRQQHIDRKVRNARAAARQKERALPTNSAEWRKIRAQQLRDYPHCDDCLKLGIVTRATVVDHLDGDAFNNDPTNLGSKCWPCHSRKTAKHDGGFGNKRREGGSKV